MGSEWREPRPTSPERLTIKSIDKVKAVNSDIVSISVTFSYEPWCCTGPHELADAVKAVERAIQESSEASLAFREAKLEEEYAPIREQLRLEQDGAPT